MGAQDGRAELGRLHKASEELAGGCVISLPKQNISGREISPGATHGGGGNRGAPAERFHLGSPRRLQPEGASRGGCARPRAPQPPRPALASPAPRGRGRIGGDKGPRGHAECPQLLCVSPRGSAALHGAGSGAGTDVGIGRGKASGGARRARLGPYRQPVPAPGRYGRRVTGSRVGTGSLLYAGGPFPRKLAASCCWALGRGRGSAWSRELASRARAGAGEFPPTGPAGARRGGGSPLPRCRWVPAASITAAISPSLANISARRAASEWI